MITLVVGSILSGMPMCPRTDPIEDRWSAAFLEPLPGTWARLVAGEGAD